MIAPAPRLPHRLEQLPDRLADPDSLGFPGATHIDFAPVAHLLRLLAIQLGDCRRPSAETRNVDDLERDVINRLRRIFHAPPGTWGYVDSGSTAAIRHALTVATRTFGRPPIVYSSTAAHSCVGKVAAQLRLRHIRIAPRRDGSIDPEWLSAAADRHHPAVLVATAGSTTTEAVDDLTACQAAFRAAAVTAVWVHTDAAMAGVPLAVGGHTPVAVQLDHPDGPNSLSVSGHKFLAAPEPCGVYLGPDMAGLAPLLPYTGDVDNTDAGCRSGGSVLRLWWSLHLQSDPMLASVTADCRNLAVETVEQLNARGVVAWRHPWAFTVVVPAPPRELRRRWRLPEGPTSRIVCMPGRDPERVAACVEDLAKAAQPRVRTA